MLNQGVSFGLFYGIPVWLIGLIWISLLIYALKMRELWERIGVGIILAGGFGNIISRLVHGAVVDNFNFFGLLYNNVWDYIIFFGVLIYGYTYYFRRQRDRSNR